MPQAAVGPAPKVLIWLATLGASVGTNLVMAEKGSQSSSWHHSKMLPVAITVRPGGLSMRGGSPASHLHIDSFSVLSADQIATMHVDTRGGSWETSCVVVQQGQ